MAYAHKPSSRRHVHDRSRWRPCPTDPSGRPHPYPTTATASSPRGRPAFYPERLFLKALVIMIVRRLHKVGELLAVLEEPTPEMRCVRELLKEGGRFPCRRTFERRLKTRCPRRCPGRSVAWGVTWWSC